MQPMLASDPCRLLAAGDVLPRHPPARHFPRPCGVGDVVDDQDVADIAFHLGRDVGVLLVHVEAVHAAAPGLHVRDELRLGSIRDVVDLEAAVVVAGLLRAAVDALAAERAEVLLDVDDHHVTDHAHLVAVRIGLLHLHLRDEARLFRIGNVEDGAADMRAIGDMADVRGRSRDVDLAGARQLHARQAPYTMRAVLVHEPMIVGTGSPDVGLSTMARSVAVLLACALVSGPAVAQEPVVKPIPTRQMHPGYGVVETIKEVKLASRERSAAAGGSAPSAGDAKREARPVYRVGVRMADGTLQYRDLDKPEFKVGDNVLLSYAVFCLKNRSAISHHA